MSFIKNISKNYKFIINLLTRKRFRCYIDNFNVI